MQTIQWRIALAHSLNSDNLFRSTFINFLFRTNSDTIFEYTHSSRNSRNVWLAIYLQTTCINQTIWCVVHTAKRTQCACVCVCLISALCGAMVCAWINEPTSLCSQHTHVHCVCACAACCTMANHFYNYFRFSSRWIFSFYFTFSSLCGFFSSSSNSINCRLLSSSFIFSVVVVDFNSIFLYLSVCLHIILFDVTWSDCAIAQMRQQPDYYLYYLFTLLLHGRMRHNRIGSFRFDSIFSFIDL